MEVVAAAMALDDKRDVSPSSSPQKDSLQHLPLSQLFSDLLQRHLPAKTRRLLEPQKWSQLEADDKELIEKRRKEIVHDLETHFAAKKDEFQTLLESIVAGQEPSDEDKESEEEPLDIDNTAAINALEQLRRNSLTKPLKSSLKADGDATKKKVMFEEEQEGNQDKEGNQDDNQDNQEKQEDDSKPPKVKFNENSFSEPFPELPKGAPTHPPPKEPDFVRPTADTGVPTIREDVMAALYSSPQKPTLLGPQLDLPPSNYKERKKPAAAKPKLYGQRDASNGDSDDMFDFDEELPEDEQHHKVSQTPTSATHRRASVGGDAADLPDKLKKEYLSYFGPIEEDVENVTDDSVTAHSRIQMSSTAPSAPMVVGSLGKRPQSVSKYGSDTSSTGAFDMWVHEEDNDDDRSFLGRNSFNPRIGEIPEEEASFSEIVGSPHAKSSAIAVGSVPYIQNPLSNSYKPNRGIAQASVSRFPSGTSFSGVGLTEKQQQRIESEPAAAGNRRLTLEERDDIDVSHSLDEEIKINEIRELAPGKMSFSQRMMYEKDGRDTQKISSSPYM
ncbi:hypothetical protein CJU90_4559 [Yarrowia sp. C11]|nr:hypothetical protein CJU90_4559 [Yarrowia sp. C11]KAG5370506.1 hypothetical protein CKK34_0608 [Yarrowia sp. E02]